MNESMVCSWLPGYQCTNKTYQQPLRLFHLCIYAVALPDHWLVVPWHHWVQTMLVGKATSTLKLARVIHVRSSQSEAVCSLGIISCGMLLAFWVPWLLATGLWAMLMGIGGKRNHLSAMACECGFLKFIHGCFYGRWLSLMLTTHCGGVANSQAVCCYAAYLSYGMLLAFIGAPWHLNCVLLGWGGQALDVGSYSAWVG